MQEASSQEESDGVQEDEQEEEDGPSIRLLSNESTMYNTDELPPKRLYPQRDENSIRKMKYDFQASSQSK